MPLSMLLRIVPQALALTLLLASGAVADESQFRSTAPLRDRGEAGVESALEDALGRLLVRVTGRRAAVDLVANFPPASSIVRHWREVEGNRLEAEFDEALVRRVLDEAGEGIWEGERPRVTLWLVVNDGERWFFRPAGPVDPAGTSVDVRSVISRALSEALKETSELRGIGIDFAPQSDAASNGECAEELWTGFVGCLPDANDEFLILGRVAVPSALGNIEWSLRENGLWRRVWVSDAGEAVHTATDILAARFMATQGPVRSYLMAVAPVPDLAAYEELKEGLARLQAVREWQVDGAAGDSLTLRITSRTAEAPLRNALATLGVPFELSRMGP